MNQKFIDPLLKTLIYPNTNYDYTITVKPVQKEQAYFFPIFYKKSMLV